MNTGYKDPLDGALKPFMTLRFWLGMGGILYMAAYALFYVPHHVVETLYTSCRGVKRYQFVPFAIASGGMFALAEAVQSPAGDGLFLLAVVFSVKWIAEWMWAHRRYGRDGVIVHRMDPGVSLLSPLKIRGDVGALLLAGLAGLVLLITPQGGLVGLIFLLGAFGGLIINEYGDAANARDRAAVRDQVIETTVEQQVHGHLEPKPRIKFKGVEIE
jgi:hypothetical protein